MISSYVSMKEQSCGTCEYFALDDQNTYCGTCLWSTKNPVPIAYTDNILYDGNIIGTYRTWGTDCPCWSEKNE